MMDSLLKNEQKFGLSIWNSDLVTIQWGKDDKVLKMANEGLEKYVMTKIFKVAFTEISDRTAESDVLFSKRQKVLKLFITPVI